MSVTELPKKVDPYVSSWTWFFDTEDEAHAFAQNERDELNDQDGFEYVEHYVDYDLKAGSWKLTLRFIDLRPNEAA